MSDHLNAIIRAFNEKGPRPDYHDEVKRMLQAAWPTLYNAIEDAAHAEADPWKVGRAEWDRLTKGVAVSREKVSDERKIGWDDINNSVWG